MLAEARALYLTLLPSSAAGGCSWLDQHSLRNAGALDALAPGRG